MKKDSGLIISIIITLLVIGGIIWMIVSGFGSGSTSSVSDTSSDSGIVATMPDTSSPTADTTAPAQPTDHVQITVVKQGQGAGAQDGDSVTVNYTGKLADGTVFDSNTDPKFQHVQPFTFVLGQHQVIDGWEQGVLGMKVGEERTLTIPPDLGYGATGAGNTIPPNATLTFDVQVTAITPAK